MTVLTIIGVIATLLAVTVSVLGLLLANKRRRYSQLPGPPLESFWSGHVALIDRKLKDGVAINDIFLELSKRYGQLFVVWFVHFGLVVLSEVVAARKIIKDPWTAYKSPDLMHHLKYTYGYRFLGKSIEAENDMRVWSRRQKCLAPFYSKKSMNDMIVIFNQLIDKFIVYIDKASEEEKVVSMTDTIPVLTSTIASAMNVGTEIGTMEEMKHLGNVMQQVMDCVYCCINNPLSQYLPSWRVFRRQAKEGCELLRNTFAKCVRARQKEISEGASCNGYDFLSLLLRAASENYSVDEIVDMILESYVASHSLLSKALPFALQEILRNPEVEQRVVEEVDRVLAGKHFISSTDLSHFCYIGCVFKETLRRYPIALAIGRTITNDTPAAGYTIPAGAFVVMSLYCMHLDSTYWPDPFKFDPERFASGIDDNSAEGYLPFGYGVRSCLGRAIAEQEFRMVLARLFQTFTFQLQQESTEYNTFNSDSLLLAPGDPTNCKIKRRLEK